MHVRRPPPPRPPRRWLKPLLWAAAAAGLLWAAAAIGIAIVFGGGLDNLLSGPGPSASDPEVVAARTSGTRIADGAALRSADAALPGAPTVGQGGNDGCSVGQHNWKIDDSYDLSCTTTRLRVMAAPAGTFREDMLAAHDRLLADGWEPAGPGTGLPGVVVDYWDQFAGSSRGAVYSQKDLPSPGYTRDADGATLDLRVDWTEPGDGEFSPDYDNTSYDPPAADVLGALGGDEYGVVLSVSFRYFHS